MLQTMFVAALIPVLAGAPRGTEKPPTKPTSPPPNKATATFDPNGVLFLTLTTSRMVPVTETRTVQIDGVTKTTTVTVYRQIIETRRHRLETKTVQAFDKDGRKLDASDLAKLIKKDTPVLVSADGKKVHPSYLKDTKAETVILILPAPEKVPVPMISKDER
jgi:hypothetical protein